MHGAFNTLSKGKDMSLCSVEHKRELSTLSLRGKIGSNIFYEERKVPRLSLMGKCGSTLSLRGKIFSNAFCKRKEKFQHSLLKGKIESVPKLSLRGKKMPIPSLKQA